MQLTRSGAAWDAGASIQGEDMKYCSILTLAICSLGVMLSSCSSGVPGVPGGLIGNTYRGIEFVDISTGSRTLLLAGKVSGRRLGPVAYDSKRNILYYVDKRERCVKASSGGTETRVLYRIPKELSKNFEIPAILLDPSGEKLYMDVSSRWEKVSQLLCLDVMSGGIKTVHIDKNLGWSTGFEWFEPGKIFMMVYLHKEHSRYDELGHALLGTMDTDTGKISLLVSSDGLHTSIMPGGKGVIVEMESDRIPPDYTFETLFRLRRLPSGEVIKQIDPLGPAQCQFDGFSIDSVVGVNAKYFAISASQRHSFFKLKEGTYIIDAETAEMTRLTLVPLGDMIYVNTKPKF